MARQNGPCQRQITGSESLEYLVSARSRKVLLSKLVVTGLSPMAGLHDRIAF